MWFYFYRKILLFFIYSILFVTYIIQCIICIKSHYSSLLLNKKYIFSCFLFQLFLNFISILFLLMYLSITFIFFIFLTSVNLKDLLFKVLKLIVFIFFSYVIFNFFLLRYIVFFLYFIYQVRQQLKESYHLFEYYFLHHRIAGIIHLLNEILYKILYNLLLYLKYCNNSLFNKLIFIPLDHAFNKL